MPMPAKYKFCLLNNPGISEGSFLSGYLMAECPEGNNKVGSPVLVEVPLKQLPGLCNPYIRVYLSWRTNT